MPVAHISAAGISRLARGSISTSRAASCTSVNNSLAPSSPRTPSDAVTSAPEAVCGMATIGSFGARRRGATSESGGVKRTAWSASAPPSAISSAIALAVSEALPPPMATKPSTPSASARAASCSTSATLECAGTGSASRCGRSPSAARLRANRAERCARAPPSTSGRAMPSASSSARRPSMAPSRITSRVATPRWTKEAGKAFIRRKRRRSRRPSPCAARRCASHGPDRGGRR